MSCTICWFVNVIAFMLACWSAATAESKKRAMCGWVEPCSDKVYRDPKVHAEIESLLEKRFSP